MLPTAVSERRPGDARRASVDVFARAVRREMQFLSQRPDRFWQQLHNRLRWSSGDAGALAAREHARRHAGGERWLETRIPFRESQALVRTLAGHRGGVDACAVSPDGSFIVSAGSDGTVRIWEPDGRE